MRVIKLAEERGVNVEGSFRHFDDRGVGLVDGEALRNGLAKLGIGISDAAADMLVAQVSRDTSTVAVGSSFFRVQDLEAYVHNSRIDERIINELEQAQGTYLASAKSGRAKIATDRKAQSTGMVDERKEEISKMNPSMVGVKQEQLPADPGILSMDVHTHLSNEKLNYMRGGTAIGDADSLSQHSSAFAEATQNRSLWAETLRQTRHTAAASRDLPVCEINATEYNRSCSYSENDEDSGPQRWELVKNNQPGHDRYDLEIVYDREGGVVRRGDALFEERAGVLTAKLRSPSSLGIISRFSKPTLEIIEKDSLSPRTLDEREKRSLINYAETRYGQAGQFRYTKVVGLQELKAMRIQDEINRVGDPGRQDALAGWARPASRKTFAEIEVRKNGATSRLSPMERHANALICTQTTYAKWKRKRNEEALILARISSADPATTTLGSDGGSVFTYKHRAGVKVACVGDGNARLHEEDKDESPPPSLSSLKGGNIWNQGSNSVDSDLDTDTEDGKDAEPGAGWQRHGFSADETGKLFEHFRQFDVDGSGDIETSEVQTLMKGLVKDMKHEDLDAMLKEVGADR